MDATPINYQLTFEPDLKKFTFFGTETITVSYKKPTNKITMHCAELKIKSCVVKSEDDIISSTPKTNEEKEELSIKLSKKIKGTVTISLEFQGILNDRLLGFYRSQYKQNGKQNILQLLSLRQLTLDVHFLAGMNLRQKPLLKYQLLPITNLLQYPICR